MVMVWSAADVIFIAGANTTESHPVFGAAIKRAHKRGVTLIVADPRRTELAARADIHLQMQPGTDVALYSGMLHHIVASGLEDRAFIAARTHGFDAVREAVQPYDPDTAAKICGVPADLIRRAAEIYARGPNTSTLWAMGLTQHATGTDIVASLLNLLLACGMIGRWGAAMVPIRGQNNVQGASDMGAIPFAYTDYRSVQDPAVRAEYARAWGVPEERMRAVMHDVGGNYGPRNAMYPEFPLILWAARRIGRPVKWTADRSECFVTDCQACGSASPCP